PATSLVRVSVIVRAEFVRRTAMPVSRRGFFDMLGGGGETARLAALLAARGHEEESAWLVAQDPQGAGAQQGGRQGGAGRTGGAGGQGQGTGRGGRQPLPEGVEEIRISSNENPLGPGKVVLDAIVGKFPEASRYPFNSTPNEGKLAE